MDILKYLLYGVIFSFPTGEILRWQLGNGIAFTLNDLFVIAFGLIYFIISKKSQYKAVLPFLLSIAISLLVNIFKLNPLEILIASLYPIRWFIYLQILFYVRNLKDKKSLDTPIILSGLMFLSIGFIQYFYYSDLHNLFYLGWDEHMYRLFSSFLDPNFAGAFYVLLFVYFLGKSFTGNKGIYIPLSFIFLIAIFITYSRSAMLMLIVSTAALFITLNKTKYLLLLFLAIFSFYLYISKYFNVESINPFRTYSTLERIDSSKIALQIFKENPIFGVGFNSYRFAQIRFGFRHGPVALVSHADASTDNSYLFVLATTGVIGFFSFAYFWNTIIRDLLMEFKKKDKNIMVVITISSLAGLFIDSLFINSLFYTFIMVWAWIVVGLSLPKRST